MPADSPSVRQLKSKLRTVQLEGVPYWLAEGDLLLDDKQLQKYANGGQANNPPAPEDSPFRLLAQVTEDGRIYRWKPGLELTYAVIKKSFTQSEYNIVVANMKQAASDWGNACGVKFTHKTLQDDLQSPNEVIFGVRKVDAQGEIIAAAFFPHDPKDRRHLVIDPSYFTTIFDKVGVLRHELGHVLGFRHEHIRSGAPPDCPKESLANTIDLSQYDPRSVMHYFCGGVGSTALAITREDLFASQRLYGPPLEKVKYVE